VVGALVLVAHVLAARVLVVWDPGGALATSPAKLVGAPAVLCVFYLVRALVLVVLPPVLGVAVVRALRVWVSRRRDPAA